MSMRLQWDSLYDLVSETFDGESGSIFIISPYISDQVIKKLIPSLELADVKILTSWSDTNLLQGSSSLDLFPISKRQGWELRILNSLHAKIFANGSKIWVGSANLTQNGLGLSSSPNDEVLTLIEDASDSDWNRIDALYESGRLVDDEYHAAKVEWLSHQPEPEPLNFVPFEEPPIATPLTLKLMPRLFSPLHVHDILQDPSKATAEDIEDAQHDLDVHRVRLIPDQDEFLRNISYRFFANPLVKYLLDQLDDKEWTRFGGMRSMMRDACGGLDVVSRDDVTQFTQNLYEWVEELDFEGNYEFGIPRRSQLIRRRPRD